ncbi:DNA polymerase III subunit gamma/tau [Shewanella mangrovi]|uniref:DNA polymerase III subunit gamma/tau n=1 Tax=Shewanella mangrovi TaxID=1515746 RepID=UPI00056082EB|nr:DNA polymerase III subunit gamma/tau [Shewanella mangrovi]
MSYQVLARKWRPASFDQVVGQSHVLHALTNALGQQRLHHAYLFTGTRGVGKTSLARLFAKGLNCEQGITATPCGKCASCVEIAQGRFVDLIEVDAASRTKVDDTRELLDNVQYRPTRGRFKVYLIDEVHMLSRSSFNALLKTLEEPPEHVKFLLATTDPQKLPVTVLSRCLQFNLKSLNQQEIGAQLTHILSQEHIPTEDAAVNLLAKAANGSMRDALSLTDQAIAFGAGQVMLTQVQTMLGSVDERQVISLLQALVNADIAELLTQADKVLAFGADANEVLRSLLELLHQITLTQFAPAAAQLSMYAEQIQTFAKALAPEQVQLYYQLLLTGRKDLPYAPDPKSGLEMALLRAVAFEPKATPSRWLAESDATAAKVQLPSSHENSAAPTLSTPDATLDPANISAQSSDDIAQASEEEDDEALAAEQALIMSQADSMGYQGYEQMPQASDYNVEDDYGTAPAEQLVDEKRYVTDEDDTEQAPFHDELTGDMFSAATPAPAAPALIPSDSEPATQGADGLFGDDLLDQVLASRDSLIKDIEAMSADEEESAARSPGLASKKVAQETRGVLPEPALTETPPTVTNEANAVENLGSSDTSSAVNQADEQRDNASSVEDIASEVAPAVKDATSSTDIAQTELQRTPELEVAATAAIAPQATAPLSQLAAPTGHPDDLNWYKLVASANIGGRVRQLAANSVCYTLGEQIRLLLKPDQKHLAAKTAVAQMESAMSEALGVSCQAVIEVGVDEQRETPLEIRHRFNRELLAQAKAALIQDDNIQWLMTQMGAELDEDSLSYPGEMLAEKTALIAS